MAPFVVHFDGGSRSKTKRSGCGAVLYDPLGEELDNVTQSLPHCTNNVAEYQGLIVGLDLARQWRIVDLVVRGDSKLVIDQVNGNWKVNYPHLLQLRDAARRSMEHFESITLEHVPRHLNHRADQLANKAMDACDPAQVL